MFFEPKAWTADRLADNLRAAGFTTADNIIVHSSLRSLGRTADGPKTVMDALLDVIEPTGNLLVPVFTYSLPGWKGDPFDHKTSRARTGSIPEYIRKDPRTYRSFHPTHSVAVIGPQADEITSHHLDASPMGVGSPFHRMLERDAKILMLGTFQDTNSTLHLCEVIAGLPYIHTAFSEHADFEIAWFQNSDHQVEFVPIREVPGCSRGFRKIEPYLEERGVLKTVRIGSAQSQVLRMRDLVDASLEILREEPTLLLCHLDHCGICKKRRKLMEVLAKSNSDIV